MKIFSNISILALLSGSVLFASAAMATDEGSGEIPSGFSFGGGIGTGGFASGNFTGTEGGSWANTEESSGINLNMSQQGDLCGVTCADVDGSMTGQFSQDAGAGSSGNSDESDTQAGAVNEIGSSGFMQGVFGNGEESASFELGGSALGAGQAGAVFSGQDGGAYTGTEGSSSLVGNLQVDSICPSCEAGSYSMDASVEELASGSSWATSGVSGQPSVAESMSGVEALIETGISSSFNNGND